ncbi:hypothetical protein [Thermoanaerobacter uzonensis]|uniref:hypothetical protein n=1 Tax=Thermoanaerobacter uzonensis TaxID=447593 RepID=UPI00175E1776|nr:hypothetical protein [Clostridia bacterium]
MFLEAVYKPTSLFSLRRSDATNPAAKSLIAPSPYSIKMALINAAITFKSFDDNIFEMIKNLEIHYNLPDYICINNCFVKNQSKYEIKTKKSDVDLEKIEGLAFKTTIGFREYVYYSDLIKILIRVKREENIDFLKSLLMRINYFGKRGSFFQFIEAKEYIDNERPSGYSYIFDDAVLNNYNHNMIIFKMDDVDKNAKFDNMNSYSKEKAMRVSKIYCFEYEQYRANKNFTLLRKIK